MKSPVLLVPFVLLVLLLPSTAADDKPKEKEKAKLPLGRDTTFVVGPLDKEGFIDYEAALNAEMGRGITPEENANVLLIQVFGPAPEGGDGLPPAFFKWLDIPAPPKEGDYFVGLGAFLRDRLALTNAQMEAVYEFLTQATQRPWDPKDLTPLAEWLKFNDKQLAAVREAMKRPRYFNPITSRRNEGEPSNLISALLPSVQKCRELASALSCRAMLRVHEGKFDEAWEDLLACHRLGRHCSHGATLIEALVGIAIGQIAANSTLAYIEHGKLSPDQLAARLRDINRLPPLAPLADKLGTCERMMGLDALQNIRRGGSVGAAILGDINGLENANKAEVLKALEKLDWTSTMIAMNGWYDRLAAAMRMKDRDARQKEFAKIEEDLQARRKKVIDAGNLAKFVAGKEGDKAVGTAIGDHLTALLLPAVQKVQMAHDRSEQTYRNLEVAFALAAYRADNGRYPAKLADLAPAYLASVPDDLFAGKPLIYKPSEKGYLFYSVGPNGKDDEGRWYDDDPPGDDPRVKMPLPPLKKQ
jgi:hypothetical protein